METLLVNMAHFGNLLSETFLRGMETGDRGRYPERQQALRNLP